MSDSSFSSVSTFPNKLRSIESKVMVFFRMCNFSHCDANIIWIDYDGDYKIYKRLKHTQTCDIDTYETHPWIFMDASTHAPLAISDGRPEYPKKILMPKADPLKHTRRVLIISLPIVTLKDCCFFFLKKKGVSPEKLDYSVIPQTLKAEYRYFYSNYFLKNKLKV